MSRPVSISRPLLLNWILRDLVDFARRCELFHLTTGRRPGLDKNERTGETEWGRHKGWRKSEEGDLVSQLSVLSRRKHFRAEPGAPEIRENRQLLVVHGPLLFSEMLERSQRAEYKPIYVPRRMDNELERGRSGTEERHPGQMTRSGG